MRPLLIIPVLLLGLLALAMRFSVASHEPTPDFTFIPRGEIKTLDLSRMSWLQDIRIAYCLWEGLYTLDPVKLDPIPGAAETIDLSDDKRIYTFHLRPSGRWHNGDRVTTADFVFAWRRMLETPGGDYTELHFRIRGARDYCKAFAAGEHPDFATVGVKAIDDLTLRVELIHPCSYFPALLAFPPFFPSNERSMRPFSRLDDQGQPIRDHVTGAITYRPEYTQAGNLIGNGPYRLAKWEFHKRLRLVAADTYWDRQHVQSRIIDQMIVEDPLATFLTYETGGTDWISEVIGDTAAELKKKGRPDLHVFPGFGTYFYSINCREKLPNGSVNPFHDPRVRRAFCMSVDKQPIVTSVTRMGEPIATDYIPPSVFAGYHSPSGQPYDVKAARALLSDAGYPDGRGFPPITILFNNEGDHPKIAQIVRKQWQDNLGVSIDLNGVEIKSFGALLHDKNYVIARASWYGDYDDASTFTDKYRSDSENNDADWQNKAFDALCDAAEAEPDSAARLKILEKAERILLNECPIIPMYHYVNVYLYRDNVTGLSLNPRNMVMLQAAKVNRGKR